MNQSSARSRRKIITGITLSLLFLLFYNTLQAQSLSVFDVDQSSFPTIKAKFYAFDKDGKQVTNLSASDFTVKEDSVDRKVTFVSCPEPKPAQTVSVAMSIDVSGSMIYSDAGDVPVELGKATARRMAEMLDIPPSEIALQTCDDKALILQDFTKDKTKFLNILTPIIAYGDNDFVEQLLNSRTGLLNIAKTGKYKRAAVIYTDAWWYPLTNEELQRCIDTCNKYDITFYAIIYTRPEAEPNGIKSSLRALCESTGGKIYDGVITLKAAEDIASELQHEVQENNPCQIEWESMMRCLPFRINIELAWNGITDNIYYILSRSNISELIFNPLGIYCKNKPLGMPFDTTITVTAQNSEFNVTNIISDNTTFEITPKSFTLLSGQSRTLNLRFTPNDSGYVLAQFVLENEKCPIRFFASGGFKGHKGSKNYLRLVHPNGGEMFAVDSDTVITWEGVLPNDNVSLEFSKDKGVTWRLITDRATGLKYSWKSIPKPQSSKCLIRIADNDSKSDVIPPIQWQKCLGGSNEENCESIIETSDGGFVVAGSTLSNNGDVSGNHSNNLFDYWIVKLNPTGQLMWQKCLGGSSNDVFQSLIETSDGGFVVAGSTYSNDGDVLGKHSNYSIDYWIVKLDQAGQLMWQKCLGGSSDDLAQSIIQTQDGGFIVAGFTYSNDGDVSGQHGVSDYWIVKLDQTGQLMWQKCLGGTNVEEARSITETKDGDFVVAGFTKSNDIDISGQHGFGDFWIVKLSQTGQLIWQKCLGGSLEDEAQSIIETSDGGFIVAGYTESNNGDASGNHGMYDFWIVKLSQSGELKWQKCLGGSDLDAAQSINQTNDGGFVVAGYTSSHDGDVSGSCPGNKDYWIVKLDQTGQLMWQKCLGGSSADASQSITETNDGGFIVAGHTTSVDRDVSGIHGGSDYWIVKLSPESYPQTDISDSVFSIVIPQPFAQDIDLKQCLLGNAKDSLVANFISNVGTYNCRIDSIYFTGVDAKAFSLVSGLPRYEIAVGASHQAEFNFRPSRVGIHQAQVVIITQGDTLLQNIWGEGIQPMIAVVDDIIDFGVVAIGESKDTLQALTIKNLGNNPVDIISTRHIWPNDKDFTTLSGAAPFSLQPGETARMDLRFTPTEIGRTNGQLEFKFNGPGSPAVVRLFGQGLGGSVVISNDSAYAGDKRKLRLSLAGKAKPTTQMLVTQFKAKLSYNKTILTMLEPCSIKSTDSVNEMSEITSGWDGSTSTLGEFEVMAGLGNPETTDLIIDEFNWLNDKGELVDFETETTNGTFKLLGICREGGSRLVNPDGKEIIKGIYPNPAKEEIVINYELTEAGYARLYLTNILGEKVKDIISENNPAIGGQSINMNINNLSSGTYYLILETINGCQSRRVEVVR